MPKPIITNGPVTLTAARYFPFTCDPGYTVTITVGEVVGAWQLTWTRNGQALPPSTIIGPIRIEFQLEGGDYHLSLAPVTNGSITLAAFLT